MKPDAVAPANLVVSTMAKNTDLFGAFPGNEVYNATGDTADVPDARVSVLSSAAAMST